MLTHIYITGRRTKGVTAISTYIYQVYICMYIYTYIYIYI